MSARSGLVVVTRAPGSEGAKTRLAAGIGTAACARLQSAFLDDTLEWAGGLADVRVLSVHPADRAGDLAARAPGWTVVAQREDEFGARMLGALNSGFAAGAAAVAMIATDSPSLPPALVRQGWDAVAAGVDVALAPAADGGWVLIAAAAPLRPDSFDGVRWSANTTFADTEAALQRRGLTVARLTPWYDVDTLADVERLRGDLRSEAARRLARTAAALAEIGSPA